MLTDARIDNGQKVITIAHPEHSSGELKKTLFLTFASQCDLDVGATDLVLARGTLRHDG